MQRVEVRIYRGESSGEVVARAQAGDWWSERVAENGPRDPTPARRTRRFFSSAPSRAELLAGEIRPQDFVWWNDLRVADRNALVSALEKAKREEDLQEFLAEHRVLLAQVLRGGHGRWVIPKVRLGTSLVTDFVIGERASYGYDWTLVELEAPSKRMFVKSGDPSAALNHAIRQIIDWRTWLSLNRRFAEDEFPLRGLGLKGISPNASGLIIIGRRNTLDSADNERRVALMHAHNIEIRTFDWLVEVADARLPFTTTRSLRK